MHKYVAQSMEMRVIVVSLSASPAACNHLHWHCAAEQMLAHVVIIRPLFCILEYKRLSVSSDVFAFASGCCQWLLTKRHRVRTKPHPKKTKQKKQPPASSLIMCLSTVHNITSHINIAFTYCEWCLGSRNETIFITSENGTQQCVWSHSWLL